MNCDKSGLSVATNIASTRRLKHLRLLRDRRAHYQLRTIMEDEYKIRRMAVDFNIPVIINLQLAKTLIDAIKTVRKKEISIKSLNEYHETLKEVYW